MEIREIIKIINKCEVCLATATLELMHLEKKTKYKLFWIYTCDGCMPKIRKGLQERAGWLWYENKLSLPLKP